MRKTLIEMAEEENNATLLPELESEITSFEERMENLEVEHFFRENMIKITQYYRFTQVPAEQKHVTGVDAYAYVYKMG